MKYVLIIVLCLASYSAGYSVGNQVCDKVLTSIGGAS